jgi:hypothetical protein
MRMDPKDDTYESQNHNNYDKGGRLIEKNIDGKSIVVGIYA